MIVDRLWLQEAEKPNEAQDWSAVLDVLSWIRAAALKMPYHYLVAAASRARIIVLS